jgi:hypothetical protein
MTLIGELAPSQTAYPPAHQKDDLPLQIPFDFVLCILLSYAQGTMDFSGTQTLMIMHRTVSRMRQPRSAQNGRILGFGSGLSQ